MGEVVVRFNVAQAVAFVGVLLVFALGVWTGRRTMAPPRPRPVKVPRSKVRRSAEAPRVDPPGGWGRTNWG